jgi:hypothetical protein
MAEEYRRLRADKLIETAERLASRIIGRFPEASLGKVAVAVADVTRNAVQTAERINRPNWALRIGLIALAAVIVTIAGTTLAVLGLSDPERLYKIGQVLSGAGLWLSAALVFFWSLETRLRRGTVVKALHELRGLAHIIDVHQLSKDPDCGPDSDPTYNRESIGDYLNFCGDLLAILSKIGQLYVEDFPDGTTLAAYQLENLTSGLSQKIWQKVMVLERLRAEQEEEPAK